MSIGSRLGGLVVLITAAWALSPAGAEPAGGPSAIRWRADQPTPPALLGTAPAAVLGPGPGASPTTSRRHVVLQLARIPTRTERQDLEAAGIRLLRYLGANAYFASVAPGQSVNAAAERAGIQSTLTIEKDWKLHPKLARGAIPEYARFLAPTPSGKGGRRAKTEKATGKVDMAALYVLFHPDVDLDPDGVAAVERHGGQVRSFMPSINGAVIWVPVAAVADLAAEDDVQWLEPPLPPLEGVNDSNRVLPQIDTLQADPYELDGAGVNVLVYDGGNALASHVDFGGRLTARDTSGLADHATHVAGTLGGSGAGSGTVDGGHQRAEEYSQRNGYSSVESDRGPDCLP